MARDDTKLAENEAEVRASGGVLLRDDGDGLVVAVIHRPKYSDWSLPKGKLEDGEGWEEAALREVEEETGFRCELGAELPAVSYLDRKGRRKFVRYWLMTPTKGKFKSHGEVDEMRWLSGREARELLTYEHDKALIRKALRRYRWRRVLRWGAR